MNLQPGLIRPFITAINYLLRVLCSGDKSDSFQNLRFQPRFHRWRNGFLLYSFAAKDRSLPWVVPGKRTEGAR
jgi:hypothetical protein